MLDQNLPGFLLCPSADNVKHHESFYHTKGDGEPVNTYQLRHADPALDSSRNCYAIALFDAFNKDVLYGEVYLQPKWNQPTASAEELKKNGGIAPPPTPMMPQEFTIQLYNPEQQILVEQKTNKLTNTSRWEFGIPQSTFREPSGSMLDRDQNDPGADATTTKINFVWKKDAKFSKDLGCYVTGKSTDVVTTKKKHKDPDIAVALLRQFKEMTIYEPNLYRVDLEDPKGLEVVLLLGVCAIRDVFLGMLKNPFNISDPNAPRQQGKDLALRPAPTIAISTAPAGPAAFAGSPGPASAPVAAPAVARKNVPAPAPVTASTSASMASAAAATNKNPKITRKASEDENLGVLFDLSEPFHPMNTSSRKAKQEANRPRNASFTYGQQPTSSNEYRPPVTDPRTQWEIDAESARLKKQVELEEREQRRAEAARRKEQERIDKEEAKRLKKMMEQEEKQRRDEQKRVEAETERLRKIYGTQGIASPPPQTHSAPIQQSPFPHPSYAPPPPQQYNYGYHPQPAPQLPPRQQPPGPYLNAPVPGWGPQTSAPNLGQPNQSSSGKNHRRSFFDLRGSS